MNYEFWPINFKPRAVFPFAMAERIVAIDRDCWNINLRELYEERYGPPTGMETVRFIVMEGVRIRSRSPFIPAVRTGKWPAGMQFGAAA